MFNSANPSKNLKEELIRPPISSLLEVMAIPVASRFVKVVYTLAFSDPPLMLTTCLWLNGLLFVTSSYQSVLCPRSLPRPYSINLSAERTSGFFRTVSRKYSDVKLTCAFPICGLFVVIRITPPEALVPYIAAAEASRSTLIDSMSSLATELISPPGTPSITTKGPCDAFTELTPRSCKEIPALGSVPLVEIILSPGTFPCIESKGETAPAIMSFCLIVDTALVSSFLSIVP
ncbi:hypothetical protein D3C87_1267870 [compost metagenome]